MISILTIKTLRLVCDLCEAAIDVLEHRRKRPILRKIQIVDFTKSILGVPK